MNWAFLCRLGDKPNLHIATWGHIAQPMALLQGRGSFQRPARPPLIKGESHWWYYVPSFHEAIGKLCCYLLHIWSCLLLFIVIVSSLLFSCCCFVVVGLFWFGNLWSWGWLELAVDRLELKSIRTCMIMSLFQNLLTTIYNTIHRHFNHEKIESEEPEQPTRPPISFEHTVVPVLVGGSTLSCTVDWWLHVPSKDHLHYEEPGVCGVWSWLRLSQGWLRLSWIHQFIRVR